MSEFLCNDMIFFNENKYRKKSDQKKIKSKGHFKITLI